MELWERSMASKSLNVVESVTCSVPHLIFTSTPQYPLWPPTVYRLCSNFPWSHISLCSRYIQKLFKQPLLLCQIKSIIHGCCLVMLLMVFRFTWSDCMPWRALSVKEEANSTGVRTVITLWASWHDNKYISLLSRRFQTTLYNAISHNLMGVQTHPPDTEFKMADRFKSFLMD